MSADARVIITLRVFGDSLVPAEITSLFGVEPTHAHAKGDRHFGDDDREYAKRRTGMWQLRAADSSECFESRAIGLLARLPSSEKVWSAITKKFGTDLCVGYFMNDSNEEFLVTAKALNALALRGISLLLDIYDPIEGGEAAGP